MTRHFIGSYTTARTHAADMAAMRHLVEDDLHECPHCLGERGFRTYPSEHSHQTIWTDCDFCDGEGTVL